MKNQTVFLLGAAAVGIGYWMFFRRQAMQPDTGLSYPQNYMPAQPQQQYPWQPQTPPRVDNQNQPWYNNSREMMSGPSESFLAGFASDLKAGASAIHSIEDIWGQMTDIFSSPDPSRDLYGGLDFLNNDVFGVQMSEVGGSDFSDWGSFDSQYSEAVA